MANTTGFNLKNFYNILMNDKSVLYQYQFVAEFHGLDPDWGISDSSDAAGNISYYIQSASIPGVTLTTFNTPYLGTEFRTPGVKTFQHSWAVNVLLVQNFKIYDGFRRWQEHISSLQLDGGGDRAIPNVTARMSILDPTSQNKIKSFILEGVWIQNVAQISLQYEQGGGNPMNIGMSLRYQYVYKDDNFDYNDPLKA
jgi:hypothetical protein